MTALRSWRVAGVILIGGLFSGTATAQITTLQPASSLKRMSVEDLLKLKVLSVSRTPQELGNAPSSIHVIGDQAARGSGATSLPELLRLAPTLFVAQTSAYDWAVGARGFTRANTRVNKLQVLIDGRTVYSPLFSGVFWDAQDVFLPDLDRIEVITGPAGVTWGANAVNGVINITTKSARDTLGSLVYAGLGSELEMNVGARHGGRIGANNAYRVYAKHRRYDDTTPEGTAVSDAWDFTQAGFRVDGGNNRTALEWTVQGDAYRGNYNADGSAGDNEGASFIARWDAHLDDGNEASLRLIHDYTRRHLPTTITEYLRTSEIDFQHQLHERGGHEINWGANYRHMNEEVVVGPGTFTIEPPARDMHLGGVFVQDTFDLVPALVRFTGGVRVEHNSFDGWHVLPSLRAAWSVAPQHTVWAGVSRATRTPSRADTDLRAPAQPPYFFSGDPDFESEELTAFELGWRGSIAAGVSASVTAYYHDYDKLRSINAGAPILITNGLAGHSTGVEAFLDWQVNEHWRFRAGGFVLDQATDFQPGDPDIEAGRGESSDPGYQFLVRSGFNLGDHVLLWLGLRSIGSVPAFDNGLDAGRIPAYTEVDATLRWEVRPGLDWSIIGRNLLHDSHPEIGEGAANRHEVQRSVHTMIQWRF